MNTNQACARCQNTNPPSARFCQTCGTPLAATMTQGQTVIMPAGHNPPQATPMFDPKAIAERARKAFGAGATIPGILSSPPASPDQREDTFLVSDISGSMDGVFDSGVTKIEALRRAAVNLVLQKHQIDRRDCVGVVAFNDRAELKMELVCLGNEKRGVIRTLQALTAGGGTDITEGLEMAREAFDWSRSDVVRRIVLLTDGEDDGNPVPMAEDLKRSGVVIDVIGIGASPADVGERLLKRVASTIQGELHYRFIKDHRTLVSHFTSLASKTTTAP